MPDWMSLYFGCKSLFKVVFDETTNSIKYDNIDTLKQLSTVFQIYNQNSNQENFKVIVSLSQILYN